MTTAPITAHPSLVPPRAPSPTAPESTLVTRVTDLANETFANIHKAYFPSTTVRHERKIMAQIPQELSAFVKLQYLQARKDLEKELPSPDFSSQEGVKKFIDSMTKGQFNLSAELSLPKITQNDPIYKTLVIEAFITWAKNKNGATEDDIQNVADWSGVGKDNIRKGYTDDQVCQKIVQSNIQQLAIQVDGIEKTHKERLKGIPQASEKLVETLTTLAKKIRDNPCQIAKQRALMHLEVATIAIHERQTIENSATPISEETLQAYRDSLVKAQEAIESIQKLTSTINSGKPELTKLKESHSEALNKYKKLTQIPTHPQEAIKGRERIIALQAPYRASGNQKVGIKGEVEPQPLVDPQVQNNLKKSTLGSLANFIKARHNEAIHYVLETELPQYGVTKEMFLNKVFTLSNQTTYSGAHILQKYLDEDTSHEDTSHEDTSHEDTSHEEILVNAVKIFLPA